MGRSVAIKSGNGGNQRIGIKRDFDFDLGDELEWRLNPAERNMLSRYFLVSLSGFHDSLARFLLFLLILFNLSPFVMLPAFGGHL